jgi:phosphohistidine phosphatase SixA
MKKLLGAMGLALSLLQSSAWAAGEQISFVEKPVTPTLLKQLRQGGFVLYMRHGITDNSQADRFPGVDLNDCKTQRLLSDEGRQLMKRVGQSLRQANIPVGSVLVSPMCRTKESAQLALGNKFEVVEALMYSANMTTEEKKPRIEALKKLLVVPPAKATNTVLVAHAPNLADLIGFFVKPEGTVVVFRQGGANGYEYEASIHPDDWAKLK